VPPMMSPTRRHVTNVAASARNNLLRVSKFIEGRL
jgi:hypothetical protein